MFVDWVSAERYALLAYWHEVSRTCAYYSPIQEPSVEKMPLTQSSSQSVLNVSFVTRKSTDQGHKACVPAYYNQCARLG